MDIVALVVLLLAFLIQIVIPKAPDGHRGLFGALVFTAAILAIFSFAVYQSWQQYFIWKDEAISKFLLPPYQSLSYFIFYARTRFFNQYLLSLLFSLLFLWAAKKLNKKHDKRFFEPIEPYLFATAIFVVGHPAWIFYLILLPIITIFLLLLINLWRFNLLKEVEPPDIGTKSHRLSLYYLWLPAAIFTILISEWISSLPWWQLFKF